MVRQETGSLVGRKPIVMKSSFRISATLGRVDEMGEGSGGKGSKDG